VKGLLCKKADRVKGLIKAKIYIEDIAECSDYAAGSSIGPTARSVVQPEEQKKACYISYECPEGTPAGNVCVHEICTSSMAKSKNVTPEGNGQSKPVPRNGPEGSCHISYQCPPGTPEGNVCINEICISKNKNPAPRAMNVKEDAACHVNYKCPPGTPEGYFCVTNSCDLEAPKQCLGSMLGTVVIVSLVTRCVCGKIQPFTIVSHHSISNTNSH